MNPRDNGRDQLPPLLHCPKCERPLLFRSEREDIPQTGEPRRVEIWLCLVHGIYRYYPNGELIRGAYAPDELLPTP